MARVGFEQRACWSRARGFNQQLDHAADKRLGASVFMISSSHKSFHRSVYWTSPDAAIN